MSGPHDDSLRRARLESAMLRCSSDPSAGGSTRKLTLIVGATSTAARQHFGHGYAHHGRVAPRQQQQRSRAAAAAVGPRGQPMPNQNPTPQPKGLVVILQQQQQWQSSSQQHHMVPQAQRPRDSSVGLSVGHTMAAAAKPQGCRASGQEVGRRALVSRTTLTSCT